MEPDGMDLWKTSFHQWTRRFHAGMPLRSFPPNGLVFTRMPNRNPIIPFTYIYLEPERPLYWTTNHPKYGPTSYQNRGQMGSNLYIYIDPQNTPIDRHTWHMRSYAQHRYRVQASPFCRTYSYFSFSSSSCRIPRFFHISSTRLFHREIGHIPCGFVCVCFFTPISCAFTILHTLKPWRISGPALVARPFGPSKASTLGKLLLDFFRYYGQDRAGAVGGSAAQGSRAARVFPLGG